jgi:alpha-amylase/alpha-mannosidase (GH57 family)
VVRVAFLWHMHQPPYRDPATGRPVLPWVRLHALRDYLGMVKLLEDTPAVHATFNLVPCLLDQIEACARGETRDGHQELSAKPAAELDEAERVAALRVLCQAHPNLIGAVPRFAELLERRGPLTDEASLREAARRFSVEDFRDLQVAANLAWFDLDWQASDPVVKGLLAKGRGFDESDKARLAERESALLAQVIPAYHAAAERGQVELSTSPYYHPILPLLCDTRAHHEAHPGAPLPRHYRHPEDAADQIRRALDRHQALFGRRPEGIWPSEGSLSEAAVQELARAGVRWTASDESVLERSVERALHRDSRGTAYPLELLYRPWLRKTPAGDVAILFRDRALSDLIGFSYAGLDPARAAADLLDRLRRIGDRWRHAGLDGDPLVGVMLDGENAWEHFRDGGRVFLREVYRGIQSDAGLTAVTLSEGLAASATREIPRVFAGSWIHADFSVWIGHADDRRAWDLLNDARDVLEEAEKGGRDRLGRTDKDGGDALESAKESFRAACASDWCWWYGDDRSSENDLEFDRLFRRHLQAVHEALGRPVPPALEETLITTRQVGAEVRQSRPTGAVHPALDGAVTEPGEWVAAGVYRPPLTGAMHHASRRVRAVRFGVGGERLHVLLEASVPAADLLAGADVALSFPGPLALRYRFHRGEAGAVAVRRETRSAMGWVVSETRAAAAAGSVLEAAVPLDELQRGPDGAVEFRALVLEGETELERHPEAKPISVVPEEVTRD